MALNCHLRNVYSSVHRTQYSTRPFFFCDSVILESICYRTIAIRLKNNSNTTGGLRKIWTESVSLDLVVPQIHTYLGTRISVRLLPFNSINDEDTYRLYNFFQNAVWYSQTRSNCFWVCYQSQPCHDRTPEWNLDG